jgi:HEAT repeat protein
LRIQGAAPALFALADEEGDPARGAALRALGRLQAEGAWEKLRAFADDAEGAEDLRMDAAEGLAELGTPEARELLRSLSADDSELGSCCKDLLEELAAADARAAREAATGAAATTSDEPKTTS